MKNEGVNFSQCDMSRGTLSDGSDESREVDARAIDSWTSFMPFVQTKRRKQSIKYDLKRVKRMKDQLIEGTNLALGVG